MSSRRPIRARDGANGCQWPGECAAKARTLWRVLLLLSVTLPCCSTAQQQGMPVTADSTGDKAAFTESRLQEARRQRMVHTQLRARGIANQRVLDAMASVPRHLFVPESIRERAYEDRPLPIGERQTISQPYIVAFMTQAVDPEKTDRVLEIGTGSGYQAAVLAEVVKEVYTIEIIPSLAERSSRLLSALQYDNVHTRTGDGYFGWPEAAPFDAIVVTAAPDHIPKALVDQLAVGAHLVIPVGEHYQELLRITNQGDGKTQTESLMPVRFVPFLRRSDQ